MAWMPPLDGIAMREPEEFRGIHAVFRQKSADFAESDLFGESDDDVL